MSVPEGVLASPLQPRGRARYRAQRPRETRAGRAASGTRRGKGEGGMPAGLEIVPDLGSSLQGGVRSDPSPPAGAERLAPRCRTNVPGSCGK